jgi:hypothetical protein
MPKSVIEREISGLGKLTPEELTSVAQKPCKRAAQHRAADPWDDRLHHGGGVGKAKKPKALT